MELRDFIEDGIRPVVDAVKCRDCGACLSVCSGIALSHDKSSWPQGVLKELSKGWGPVLEVWEGHAADDEIRFKGGSGGAATALALYCLEREGAAGVLHVAMDPQRPWLNQTVVSRNREELADRTGSRYSPAAVCAELGEIERSASPMVLIGKPCDIASAQKARKLRPGLDRNLLLTISIFCGGTPSTGGTLKLLEALDVTAEDVGKLRYRGNGWPGMTGVNLKSAPDGRRVEMPYREAWDTILTKHKPFRCHICPDGTGEFADIACGDPWYRPIQEGELGSTLILVRTERGREVLRGAMEAGYIVAERRQADVLARSQVGLLQRRQHVLPKLVALWLMRLPCPMFRGLSIWRNWLKLSFGRKFVSFFRALRHALSFRRRGLLKLTGGEPIYSAKDQPQEVKV